MVHIVANIAWCSSGWTEPTLEGIGFGYVREGNLPHEGYNFRFDHPRNQERFAGHDVVYGYVEMQAAPRKYKESNDGQGVCFFSSRRPEDGQQWIAGLYGHCWIVEPRRELEPAVDPEMGVEFVNLCGEREWSLAFEPTACVQLHKRQHLAGKERIGRIGFAYVGDEQARAILSDAVSAHRELPGADRRPSVRDKIATLEGLLIEVGGLPRGLRNAVPDDQRRQAAETYREGQRQAIETEVTVRNPALARDAKERDQYTCQVCGFRYAELYGERGRGFVECHHLAPLGEVTEEHEVTLDSVVTVCANCHRMLHHGDNVLTVEELQGIMNEQGWQPTEEGE